jgi:hypothetical protein
MFKEGTGKLLSCGSSAVENNEGGFVCLLGKDDDRVFVNGRFLG